MNGMDERLHRFEILKPGKKDYIEEKGKSMSLLKITNCITKQDAEVEKEVKKCMESFDAYYEAHIEGFEERGIEEEELEDYEEEELQWLALADLLVSRAYCCELDWKCYLEDFCECISQLQGVEEYNLTIEQEWFDEEGDVTDWCTVLEEKWKDQGMCIGALDLDSDCYVLFPVPSDELEQLIQWAEEIGQRIDHGENM